MSELTLKSLQKLREEQKKVFNRQGIDDRNILIIVGMGTCGIAAGAREVFNVFLSEAETQNMSNVVVKQTGCMGLCYAEPTVEIKMAGMPDTLYGKVDSEISKKIVATHLLGGKLVNEHVYGYPARDILKE